MSAPDFFANLNDFLADSGPNIQTQEELEDYLKVTQQSYWDIPSALGSICPHDLPETNHGDFFMHRNEYWDNDWAPIDNHFKEVHNFDLTSKTINWSFDT